MTRAGLKISLDENAEIVYMDFDTEQGGSVAYHGDFSLDFNNDFGE